MKKLSSISFAVAFLVQVAWAVGPTDLAEDLAALVAEGKGVLMPDLDSPHVENRGVMELADGLVNLHEYWTGCDPWTVDGTNTLLSVIATSIDTRIAGVTNVSVAWPLYNNYISNGNAGIFERNANCWAYEIDLSCTAVWRTPATPHNVHLGTLISPRHVLASDHASTPTNNCFVFQSMDGLVVTNHILGMSPKIGGDISVYLLQDEMPTNFPPAKVLPADYAEYIGTGVGLPVLATDQDGKALVYDISAMEWMDTRYPDEGWKTTYRISENASRAQFHEEMIEGDSGRPIFFLCGADIVLVGAMWKGHGYERSPATFLYWNDIQAAMNNLSTRHKVPEYSLHFFDLSPYNTLLLEP